MKIACAIFAIAVASHLVQAQGASQSKVVSGQSTPTSRPNARILYVAAAEHLDAGRVEQAVVCLEKLSKSFPHSRLAKVAGWHLIECHVVVGDYGVALKMLEDDPAPPNAQAVPDLKARCRIHLAKQAALKQDFAEAFDHLLKIPNNQTLISNKEITQERLRLVRVATNPVGDDNRGADFQIEATLWQQIVDCDLSSQERHALMFAVAEGYTSQGRFRVAQEYWEQLAAELNEASLPAWAAIVWLRQSEQGLRDRNYQQAESKLQELSRLFPDLVGNPQLVFVKARIAISDLRFEDALQQLQSLADLENSSAEDRSQALWLTGEIYFMQHRFKDAIQVYEHVLALESHTWRPLALQQTAKCYEKLGQPNRALEHYRMLLAEYEQSAAADLASSRVAVLESLPLHAKSNTQR